MPKSSDENMTKSELRDGRQERALRERLMHSRFLSALANFPPVAWLVRGIVRRLVGRRGAKRPVQEATIERAAAIGLDATLQGVVQDVVEVLGYTGAMVATYEHGDSLPVRAMYVDPLIATAAEVRRWEHRISEVAGWPVSITDPDIARVYVYNEAYSDNLSVRAAQAGGPVTSDHLYDLFAPIAPPASRPIVEGIQQAMGIQQVIAVPFFLETLGDANGVLPADTVHPADKVHPADTVHEKELVGNLFAAKRSKISDHDILVLSAFGRQAAAAIGNERRRLQIAIAQDLTFHVQTSLNDEAEILEWIVKGVVSDLGYVGAMVAPYEPDGSLPSLALYVDPSVATEADIHRWERQISEVSQTPVSIFNSDIARVYVNRPEYSRNLSVRAAKAGKPVTSDALYDLFVPIAPPASESLVRDIQRDLGIQQVVAVPFFLETITDDGQFTHELVGNLFAATRSQSFKSSEIELLRAFGQQAAAGIRNARLYRKAEERRQAAQLFGKMAFSAATAVHALRNHVGIVRLHIDLLQYLPPEKREAQLSKNPEIRDRLDTVADILDTLGEPWRRISDEWVDVNVCLHRAVNKILPLSERHASQRANSHANSHASSRGVHLDLSLSQEPLKLKTSPDMLTEVFRVLIKNAFEAIQEKGSAGHLRVTSGRTVRPLGASTSLPRSPGMSVGDLNQQGGGGASGSPKVSDRGVHPVDATDPIEILIQDNGVGIRPENINKIFEIGWTTKSAGMGFGLFWARDYIEGIGGSITVESVLGEGTTFCIRLSPQRADVGDENP
jgi:signal transduction histidine kinase